MHMNCLFLNLVHHSWALFMCSSTTFLYVQIYICFLGFGVKHFRFKAFVTFLRASLCMLLSPFLVHLFQLQAEFQILEERKIYDHVIVAFVRICVLQKKEQTAGFNNSQEVDTSLCFHSVKVWKFLGFFKKGLQGLVLVWNYNVFLI